MMMRCYTVFDRKTLSYHLPYYAVNDSAAVRTLSDAVSDVNSLYGRHPNDFVLYCCGTFDDQKGAMEPSSPLLHVIDAIALVKAIQSEIPFPEHTTTSKPSLYEKSADGRTYTPNGEVR